MSKVKNKIVFVIATKDRPAELHYVLTSLEIQSYPVDHVIIVDGGTQAVEEVAKGFTDMSVTYLRCAPPSAARQRNLGIKEVGRDIDLVGFLDDDIELEKEAVEAMMRFWTEAPEGIGGAAFNMINSPPLYASRLKSLRAVEMIGLYSKNRGRVLPSGFHTIIDYLPETMFVQWLPTGAVVWRRKILEQFKFDEWFVGYSYLEDLDFSYRVGKWYHLAVVSDARYYHYPASEGRGDSYVFGKREVANRLYFVRKHPELSLRKCYLSLVVRILISLSRGVGERKPEYFQRALGNILGLLSAGA
jgi:GT2 family glycosyltransferase